MSSENTDIRNRRFYERKEFWIALASVAVAVCVRYAVEKHNDRPLTFRPVESVDAEPDYAHGVGIDFRRRLEARQEANLMPADENGWKLVLQAFGPIALDHKSFVERTPWEQLAGEYWFKREWTPLCEKYGIDPTVPPEFLTRLDLYEYLIKNGISGEEPEASDSDLSGWSAKERYWENYEEKTGCLDSQQVIDGYQRLLAKPWTKEECPVAARWIEENADLYDVLARAVRSPRFGCWRFISEESGGWLGGKLYFQFSRDIARKFAIRANYRTGTGDFSGAVDDVESLVLLAKSFFVNRKDEQIVNSLVGVAILGIAAGVALDGGSSDAGPSPEDRARLEDVWNGYFGKLDFNASTLDALKGERDSFYLPISQEIPALIRNGSLKKFLRDLSPEPGGSPEYDFSFLRRLLLVRGSFDDGLYMAEMERLWNELLVDQTVDIREWASSYRPKSREKKLAKKLFLLLGPAIEAFGRADERVDCVVKLKLLTLALLRYQSEHGALPPAFTVDGQGKPLHSWRVLILPYLGEENKALYGQIRLDEPWDSDYNRQFHASSPKIFRCSSNKNLEEGSTAYSVILGEDALFDASGAGKDLAAALRRGGVETSRQALIVERERPVCWMKPDAELDARSFLEETDALDRNPDNGHAGGINVGHADGSVTFFQTYGVDGSAFDLLMFGTPLPESDGGEEE